MEGKRWKGADGVEGDGRKELEGQMEGKRWREERWRERDGGLLHVQRVEP